MYAKYSIASNASVNQVYEDLKKLLTGTTDKNLLSASCDVSNTEISTAYTTAGWEYITDSVSHDQANSVTSTTLTSPTKLFYSSTANKFVVATGSTAYRSDDTVTWTLMSTIASPIDFTDNGNVLFAIRQATSTGFKSTDATTWTLPTTSVVGTWTAVASVPNGAIMTVGNNWICAVSTDNGDIFTSKTALATLLVTGNATAIASLNGKFMVAGGAGLSAITTDNGTTWTQKTAPTTFISLASGNGVIVGISSSSTTAGVYNDTTGAWETVTLPISISVVSSRVVFDSVNNIFIISRSATELMFSKDGKTWLNRTYTASFLPANLATKAGELYTLNTTLSVNYKPNWASGSFRAVNLLAGTHKYMHLSLGNGGKNRILMRSFESLEQGKWLNLCNGSDSTTACQQMSLTNGSVIYISASARHCAMFSYLPSSNTWGASTGNAWTSIHEYTRDDLWNDETYPSHFWSNGTFATVYVPRLLTGIGTDTVGASAALSVVSDSPITKPVLDSAGTGQAQPMRSMRVDSNAFATYAINGGTVLGDVYRTTDSYGTTLNELTLGAATYVVWATGTTRYLYRKG